MSLDVRGWDYGEGEVAVQNSETPENGDIVVKFDNGEVHTYDLTSQRKLRPVVEDAHKLSASTLFDMLDTDSSNSLDRTPSPNKPSKIDSIGHTHSLPAPVPPADRTFRGFRRGSRPL